MIEITKATNKDAQDIMDITHNAFIQYKNELEESTPVKALAENIEDILKDIKSNYVLIAKDNNTILGCVRLKRISQKLAYLYRFSVLPNLQNSGVGSMLLEKIIDVAQAEKFDAICLHTNTRYYKLARYYYGKQFYVHSTTFDRGYIRGLFVKELNENGKHTDLSPAFSH